MLLRETVEIDTSCNGSSITECNDCRLFQIDEWYNYTDVTNDE